MTDRPDPTDPPSKPNRLDEGRIATDVVTNDASDRQNLADTRAELPPAHRAAPPRTDPLDTPDTVAGTEAPPIRVTRATEDASDDAVPMDASATTPHAGSSEADAPTEGSHGAGWFVPTNAPAEERQAPVVVTPQPPPDYRMGYALGGVAVLVVVLGLAYVLLG